MTNEEAYDAEEAGLIFDITNSSQVEGAGLRAWAFGLGLETSGFRVQDLGFTAEDLGL